jgi:hypothetical protein
MLLLPRSAASLSLATTSFPWRRREVIVIAHKVLVKWQPPRPQPEFLLGSTPTRFAH